MILREAPIAEITEAIIDYRGKTPPKSASGIRLLTAKVIKDGTIDESRLEYISDDTYSSWMRRGFPRERDILITTEAPLGETAILRDHERVALAQRVILLRGDARVVDQEYLFAALRSPLVQSRLRQRATGTTVLGIKQSELRQVLVPVPSLSTQRKIAAIVSAYDDLIENNARRIKLLEEMAQRIYREWFVALRYPGHGTDASAASELGSIPAGWQWTTVGNITANFDRKRKPLSGMERARRPGAFPYYGAAKVFDYIDDYLFDGTYLLVAEDGSVMTNDGFPVLQYVTGKFWANNHTHILQGRCVSTEYLYMVLKHQPISGFVTGAAQPKITQANLNRIQCLLPPQTLLGRFDKAALPIFSCTQTLLRANAKLRATRDLLLPRLIAGEIDVDGLDVRLPEAA